MNEGMGNRVQSRGSVRKLLVLTDVYVRKK